MKYRMNFLLLFSLCSLRAMNMGSSSPVTPSLTPTSSPAARPTTPPRIKYAMEELREIRRRLDDTSRRATIGTAMAEDILHSQAKK